MAAALFLTILPGNNALTASAAEPTKYLVAYDASDGEWKYRAGADNWDDAEAQDHWELYYLENGVFKDGDTLIIEGSAPYEDLLKLDLSKSRIGNLTVKTEASGITVKAGSIDECHMLDNSSASITGPIKNAYVYDHASTTFLSDIETLHVIGSDVEVHATVNCQGTVGHVIAKDDTWVRYEYYNVAKDQLKIESGGWQTDEAYYSTTPGAQTSNNQNNAAPAPSNPAPSNNNAASNEYDAVPKTGDSFPVTLLLVGIAAVCFAGRTALKRA